MSFQHLGPTFYRNGYQFMHFNGSLWLKIFYHNFTGKVFFEGEDEVLQTNSYQKYSILLQLSNSSKINNLFEFILHWPDLNDYTQWKQSNNPIYEYESDETKAEGFQYIKNASNPFLWGGLVRTTKLMVNPKPNSLLDGNPGATNWNCAIGMYYWVYEQYHDHGIPAYYGAIANYVVLWVRTPIITSFHHLLRSNILISVLMSMLNIYS